MAIILTEKRPPIFQAPILKQKDMETTMLFSRNRGPGSWAVYSRLTNNPKLYQLSFQSSHAIKAVQAQPFAVTAAPVFVIGLSTWIGSRSSRYPE